MGFFSDLKEDLSQAVNELMPENPDSAASEPARAEDTQLADSAALEEMLKNIDNIAVSVETAEESVPELREPAAPEPIVDRTIPEEAPKSEALSESREMEKRPEAEPAADETAVITAGMVIAGDVTSESSIDIFGTVNGNVETRGKLNITGAVNGDSKAAEVIAESAKINGGIVSEGSVRIGASTVVIGNISATGAVIAGAVRGDIDVHGPVILESSAIVMGDIKSRSVQINNGAVIEGLCSQCYAEVNPTSFFDDYKPEKIK